MRGVSIFDGTAWVSIVGPPGADGVDGKDGSGVTIKGTAAAYPPDAAPTVGDMWLTPDPVPGGFPAGTNPGEGLVWTGTEWNNVGGIRGPKGADGADGADGAPGQDGAPGADGAKGDTGADGQGFKYAFEWQAGNTYELYDVVSYNGSTFVLLDNSVDPNATPDANAEWGLMAQKGSDGAKGDKGDPGADGTAGSDGTAGADGAPGADGADGRSVAVTVSATQPATAAVGDLWIEPT